jgi:hypothetical protein
MWLPLMVVALLCFFGFALFALHRKTDVSISMSVWRLFDFTIDARDAPALRKGRKVPSGAWENYRRGSKKP